MSEIISAISKAETRWPQLRFKKKTNNEASASCPFCHNGIDRFVLFADGDYWCRQCNTKGWTDEKDSEWGKMDATERRLRILEAEQRRAKQEREEQDQRLSALERMHNSKDHLRFHFDMTTDQMAYWLEEGMTVDTIMQYQLGWCPHCPTDINGGPSYTIPVFDRDGSTLINIRHRLVGGDSGNKYRPHAAGLGVQLFNARLTNEPAKSIIILEGEKKSICLDQWGFPNVGIMGKRSFKREWMDWLESFPTVYVALDPDASESAGRLAGMFGERGRVVTLPVKADDFFTLYGGTRDDFKNFVGVARKATNND